MTEKNRENHNFLTPSGGWNIWHTLLISFLLHLLLISVDYVSPLNLLKPNSENSQQKKEKKPLKFRFTNIQKQTDQKPEDKSAVSDRTLRASDKSRQKDSNKPKIEGKSKNYTVKTLRQRKSDTTQKSNTEKKEAQKGEKKAAEKKSEVKNEAVEKRKKQKEFGRQLDQFRRDIKRLQFDNPEGGAAASGAISFDTTYHNLGPYASKLQRRIELNWEPPMAYYSLHQTGSVKIHFYIKQNGELEGLKILESSGSEPLDRAAYFAVKNSFRFDPLPDVVKKDKLGATMTFHYL